MATTHRIGLRRRLRHAASFMGMVALSALTVLLAQHLLTPSGARAQATCSNATLNGAYSALASGFSLFGADGAALPAPAPRVAIQLLTLDGSGNISRTGTRNNGGAIGPTDVSGTYAVNPDCRFSVTFTPATGPAAHVAGVIVNGGSEAFVISADPNTDVTSATWKRQ